MDEVLKSFGIAALIVIVIAAIFEISIVGMAYFYADEVSCNWLWCEFKSTRTDISINSNCYQNGKPINCSEIDFPDMNDMLKDIQWNK